MSKLITSILCVWIVLLAPLVGGCSDSQPSNATTPTFLSPSSVTDKQALIALYNATDGPNWNYSDYWLTDPPIWAWYGVTVDAEGRVTELDL